MYEDDNWQQAQEEEMVFFRTLSDVKDAVRLFGIKALLNQLVLDAPELKQQIKELIDG